jgi:hypothetical protein
MEANRVPCAPGTVAEAFRLDNDCPFPNNEPPVDVEVPSPGAAGFGPNKDVPNAFVPAANCWFVA